MRKLLKLVYPKIKTLPIVRFTTRLITPALRGKWKKNPIVADWVKKGWVDDAEIDEMVLEWEKFGSPVRVPHKVKQLTVSEYARNFGCQVLVETGTFRGDMIEAQRSNFKRVYSVELANGLWEKAVTRFQNDPHVTIIQGDSSRVLRELVPTLTEATLFWLDGHYCGGDTAMGDKECPIYAEIEAILNSSNGHVMLVDDARLFVGKRDYPTITQLAAFVKALNSEYHLTVSHDIIRIVKAN
jgi:hypothetical protein